MPSFIKRFKINQLIFVALFSIVSLMAFLITFLYYSDILIKSSREQINHLSLNMIEHKVKDISSQINIYLKHKENIDLQKLKKDSHFLKIINQKFEKNGHFFLIDNKGNIHFYKKNSISEKHYSVLSKRENFIFKSIAKSLKFSSIKEFTILQHKNTFTTKYIAITTLKKHNFRLAAFNEIDDFYHPIKTCLTHIKQTRKTIIIVYSIIILICFTIIFVLTSLFLKKIKSDILVVTNQALSITADNKDFGISEIHSSEIRKISESITEMTSRLKNSFNSKNEILDELTKTTSTLNNVLNSSTKYGIIATNKDGNIELFNFGAQIIFQHENSEVLDKNISILFDKKELNDQGFLYFMEIINEHGTYDTEITGIRKDGTSFPMSISIAARFDETLEIVGILAILYDRTEEKLAEELKIKHEKQKEKLDYISLLFEKFPIGVIVTDEKDVVTIENEAVKELLDYKDNKTLLGNNFIEDSSIKKSGLVNIYSKTIDQNKQIKLTNIKYISPKSNIEHILDITFTPLNDIDGNRQGIIITFIDRTLLHLSIGKMTELNTIINRSPVVAYTLNTAKDNLIEFISDNVLQLGYKPEDFKFSYVKFGDIIHEEDKPQLINFLKNQKEGKNEFRVKTSFGGVRWVEGRNWFKSDKKHIQGIMFDITERIKAREQINRQNDILLKYVDKDVLNFMMDKNVNSDNLLFSETVNASIIFIDICGFTAISETYTPDIVISMLNRYFDVIVQELISRNGHVDKFIGDAIMAVFKGDYHLERAIEACIAIRKRVTEMMSCKDKDIEFSPNVSIGLNAGDMISGNIGSETLERLDYTVIGDVVNTSSRFQSVAEEGQIIISEDVYEVIKDIIDAEEIGKVTLKNKENPILVYNVLDFR